MQKLKQESITTSVVLYKTMLKEIEDLSAQLGMKRSAFIRKACENQIKKYQKSLMRRK